MGSLQTMPSPCRGLIFVAAALLCGCSAWNDNDYAYDDSMNDDSTISTLAHNDEDQYSKTLNRMHKLDGGLLDDDITDGSGSSLSNELSGAMNDLEHSKDMDSKAKAIRRQKQMMENDDEDVLGESEEASAAKSEASGTQVDAKRDDETGWAKTNKLFNGDLGEDASVVLRIADPKKKEVPVTTGIQSSGGSTCTGSSCSGTSSIKPAPGPAPT